jgi:hypothetical protein
VTHAWDRTVVTRPEDEKRALDAAEQIRPGVRIISSRHVPEGKMFIFDDEAIEKIVYPGPLVVTEDPHPIPFNNWPIFNPRSIVMITDTA